MAWHGSLCTIVDTCLTPWNTLANWSIPAAQEYHWQQWQCDSPRLTWQRSSRHP
jgi:hypothetical protein